MLSWPDDMHHRSRGIDCPSFALDLPSETEGAGKAGCESRTRSLVRKMKSTRA